MPNWQRASAYNPRKDRVSAKDRRIINHTTAEHEALDKVFLKNPLKTDGSSICQGCNAEFRGGSTNECKDRQRYHLNHTSGAECSNLFRKEFFLACKKYEISDIRVNSKDPMMEAILKECKVCENGTVATCTCFNVELGTSECQECDGRGYTIIKRKKTNPNQNGNHSISGDMSELGDVEILQSAFDKLPTDSVGGSTPNSTTASQSEPTATSTSEMKNLTFDDKPDMIALPSMSPQTTATKAGNVEFLDAQLIEPSYSCDDGHNLRRLGESNHSIHDSSTPPVLGIIPGFVLLGFILKKVFCRSRQTLIPIHDEE